MFTLLPWQETITEQTNSALSRLITHWLKASAGVSKDDMNTIYMLIILYKKNELSEICSRNKNCAKTQVTKFQGAHKFTKCLLLWNTKFIVITAIPATEIYPEKAESHSQSHSLQSPKTFHISLPFLISYQMRPFPCGVVTAVCKLTINAFPPWQVLSFAKRKQWTVLSFWSDKLHSSWSETIRCRPLEVLTDLVYST